MPELPLSPHGKWERSQAPSMPPPPRRKWRSFVVGTVLSATLAAFIVSSSGLTERTDGDQPTTPTSIEPTAGATKVPSTDVLQGAANRIALRLRDDDRGGANLAARIVQSQYPKCEFAILGRPFLSARSAGFWFDDVLHALQGAHPTARYATAVEKLGDGRRVVAVLVAAACE